VASLGAPAGGGGGGAALSDAAPLVDLTIPAAGTLEEAARADHRHPLGGVFHQKYVTGKYYGSYTTAVSNGGFNPDNISACPIFISREASFNAIGFEVIAAGGAAEVLRLGIYDDTGNGFPGALRTTFGTAGVATTGIKLVTIALTLPAGQYWLSAQDEGGTGSLSVRTLTGHTFGMPTNHEAAAANAGHIRGFQTAGTLVSTFPSIADAMSFCPRLYLRAA
jgi:hypothetical protein